jgi:hypothetical protein
MAPFVFQRVICFSFPGARPHWLRHARSGSRRGPVADRAGAGDPARRARAPPPPAVAHVKWPGPGRAPGHSHAGARPTHHAPARRVWTTTANGRTTAARDAPAPRPRGTQPPEVRGERAAERHRAADRKTPTRATASRLIHGGHAHDFMRGRCTHLNNGTHQNNDQICSLDGHQNANMAQANTPVVRHGPGGAVTADATAHNYNVSRRTAIIIYGLASSAGSTLPASCHAGISSHAEHHEAHIHHRA